MFSVNVQFCAGLRSQPSRAACGPRATGWTPLAFPAFLKNTIQHKLDLISFKYPDYNSQISLLMIDSTKSFNIT